MRTLALILLLSVVSVRATMTLQKRELFQGVGTLTSGSPGANFTSVTGSLFKRPGGPYVSPDTQGYSADLQFAQNSYGRMDYTASGKAFLGAWCFFKSISQSANDHQLLVMLNNISTVGPFITAYQGTIRGGISGGTMTALPITPTNQWIYLAIAYRNISGTTGDCRFYYKLPGGSLTQWTGITNASVVISNPAIYRTGAASGGGGGIVNWRLGAPSVYSFTTTDFSDIVYPADLAEPTTGMTWYVNPSTGSDSNDGISSGTAWLTAAKVSNESTNVGMFSASSYASGDTLVIDTSGSSLDLSGNSLWLCTSGLNVQAANGQTWATIKPYRTIAAGDWQTVAGLPAVYSTTNTTALCVIWENDKWLNHPNGASLASVTNSLQTTAGSFWTDGTTLYVHPFGDTDPRSDGKTYDRSFAGLTSAAVNLAGRSMNVRDIYIRKTCDAAAATGAPNGGYAIGTANPWSGSSVVSHCYADYAGKHTFGFVADGAAGDSCTFSNLEGEQASPYGGVGAQTIFVSYSGGASSLGITHTYSGCVSTKDTGLIGSTAGVSGSNSGGAWYCHGASGSNQFNNITITNCTFGDSSISYAVNVSNLYVYATRSGGVATVAGPTLTCDRTYWTRRTPEGSATTIRNSIISPVLSTYTTTYGNTSGAVTVENCTYDMRSVSHSFSSSPLALLSRSAASTILFRNSAVILPSNTTTQNFCVFKDFVNTDSLVSSNNVVYLNGQTVWSRNYNDGSSTSDRTFAQWQALGFDANSLTNDPALRTDYRPQPWSKTRNAGVDLGPLVDFTGKTFAVRKQIGAYEWQVLNPYFQMGVRP